MLRKKVPHVYCLFNTINYKPANPIYNYLRSYLKNSVPPVDVQDAKKVNVEKELQLLRKKNKEMLKEESGSDKESTDIVEDKFVSKDHYLQQLLKKREEEENESEKLKRLHEHAQKRLQRQEEVIAKSIDYSTILIENINIMPESSFSSLDQLLYFIHNAKGQLTEENFNKCLEGFIFYAEFMNENDLENPSFLKFLELSKYAIRIIAETKTFSNLTKFLDLYCIENNDLWIACEQKFIKLIDQMEPNQIIDIVLNFGNQAEGTDILFNKAEKQLEPLLSGFSLSQITKIVLAFYNRKEGSKEFFQAIFQVLNDTKIAESTSANIKDLARLSLIVLDMTDHLKKYVDLFYANTEKMLIKLSNDIMFEHACVISEGFGQNYGFGDLNKILHTKILPIVSELNFENLKPIINGFVLTYKASDELINAIKPKILAFKNNYNAVECALIAKSIWISGNDDLNFYQELEEIVLYELRNNKNLTDKDIYEMAVAYNITRNGSRQLYRILELILTPRLENIGKNQELLKKLHSLYTKSGLCTADFIESMDELILESK